MLAQLRLALTTDAPHERPEQESEDSAPANPVYELRQADQSFRST